MLASNHQNYKDELGRLKFTIECIRKCIDIYKNKRLDFEDNIQRLKTSYENQFYAEMMVNMILTEGVELKLHNLDLSLAKPYFARINFKEKGKNSPENLYLGKISLQRTEDNQLIIVDWRAPIANLYYEGKLGEESYICPDGKIDGELLLKRQFVIENGELEDITDTDIVANDELLKKYLQTHADNKLKDIVSTIQVDQNRIIRENLWDSIIVQGSAGSGKTTIALHRIAYLIYAYSKSVKPEDFMIIGPNKIFLNYISEVLPELGVNLIKQATIKDFLEELLGKQIKVKDQNQRLIEIITPNKDKNKEKDIQLQIKASKLKSSLLFKDALMCYIDNLETSFIPDKDFKVGDCIISSKQDIHKIFEQQLNTRSLNQSLNQKLEQIEGNLLMRIENYKESIVSKIESIYARIIVHLKSTIADNDQRLLQINKALEEQYNLIDKVRKKPKMIVSEYIGKINKTPLQYYQDFINSQEYYKFLTDNNIDQELITFTKQYTLESLKKGIIEAEDFAPVMYIKYRINGLKNKIKSRHIVIDEAQDVSPFQFFVLKQIAQDASFTILGDLCQGIYSYKGTNDWSEIQKDIFDQSKCKIIKLDKSYRTTIEIMEMANKVIEKMDNKNITKALPMLRHGKEVVITNKINDIEILSDIADLIISLNLEGHKSIAIICKTINEGERIFSQLKDKIDSIKIINDKETEYNAGVMIMPSHLAKGLEFDAVIIPDASSENYKLNDLDAKLLYVSMTRPLHRLHIYYHEEMTKLLS